MPDQTRKCRWCGREFTAHRSDNVYCSARCRRASSYHRLHGYARFHDTGAVPTVNHAPVSRDEIADAVLSLHGAEAVFSAAVLGGEDGLKPMCERLRDDLLMMLSREGL